MFSVTDAAFTGFRVVRSHPGMLPWWTGLNLVISVITLAIMIGMAGSALQDIQSMDQANPDVSLLLDAYARMGPAYLLILVVSLLFYGVLYAAANRAVLTPEDSRMGYLRFGGVEVRQALLLLVISLIMFGIYLGSAVVGGVVMAILSGVGGRGGAAFGVFLMAAIIISSVVFFGVKLSLSNAQTFATGRFNVFGSWSLTKGRFWPILGVYVIAAILVVIIYALILGVFAGVVFVSGGMPAVTQIFAPDTSSFEAFISPATIAYYILAAATGALTTPIWLAPAPFIYQQVARSGADEVFA